MSIVEISIARSRILLGLFVLLLVLCSACNQKYEADPEIAAQLPSRVDFNFHIKPILSDRCFSCHGPDQNALKADLRLDMENEAFVSGNLSKSQAFQRICSSDPEKQMPPPEFQRRVSSYEIALIARWIEQGAEYKPHWAFIPPRKVTLPEVQNKDWSNNAIDRFVLQQLEQNKLSPNIPASKEVLLRRLSLDLTGIPPTLEEIDAFLNDGSPNAYEKAVDRLLASPHFGERMALKWLDLARYADSNGYSQDGLRTMWPWRDWVIEAFNNNMPFDRFLKWQLAGDRLPNATQEQRLATGFLRNHRQNGEGGIVDEEYRVEYAADRTETAATVFMGLTFQCARCHDHKYDPISQEEYYGMFSFFNSVHEAGITANDGNSGPELILSSKEVDEQIRFIDRMIREKEKEAEDLAAKVPVLSYQVPVIDLKKGLVVDLSFDQKKEDAFLNRVNPSEHFSLSGAPEIVEGRIGKALRCTSHDFARIVKPEVEFDRADAFTLALYVKSFYGETNNSLLNHLGSKGRNFPGYEVAVDHGYPTFRLVHSMPAHQIEVRGMEPLIKGEWTYLAFTYDGSGRAAGVSLFINGKQKPVQVVFDKLNQSFANNKKVLTVGGRRTYQTNHEGFNHIDEVKVFTRALSAVEIAALSTSRADHQWEELELKTHYLNTKHAGYQGLKKQIQSLRREKFSIQDTLITVMVMEDLPEPRPTFVLDRGVYDAPTKPVRPGFPSALRPMAEDSVLDRSHFAEWLLNPQHPLTSRVAVNRFWQHFFGQGLVKTADDFGNQGALPSHPELLDWLSIEFIESGWDVKAMLRYIVLSSTYQQASSVDATARAQDPENVFLSRGPSERLSGELIRDVALAASGLLAKKIGGPSVKPYQPAGLWSEKGEFSKLKNYQQDKGENLYRRSLYTFWRRTAPPPSMITFNAPTRDICIVSRQKTNTPLQALVLLNDPQFIEAARILAERVIRETTNTTERIELAYRLLTGLKPSAETLELLRDLEKGEYQKYRQQPQLTRQLLQVGEHPVDARLEPAKVAALSLVCSTIMSFDETLVKR